MSLLNEVLRDIDQRRREARDEQILTSVLVSEEQAKKDWFGPAVAFVAIFILGSLTYWAVNQNRSSNILYSTFELPSVSAPMQSDAFIQPRVLVSATVSPKPLSFISPTMALQKPALSEIPRVESFVAGAQNNTRPAETLAPRKVAAQEVSPVADRSVPEEIVPLVSANVINPSNLMDQFLATNMSIDVLGEAFKANIYSWSVEDVSSAMSRISYSGRSIDDLATLLEMNRLVETAKGLTRFESIIEIYSQLRLKSEEPGYWAFQQAVLLDKSAADPRQAYYYYRQAIQSDHITTRQRKLSKLRIEQLRYDVR